MLNRLELKHFKCFESLQLPLAPLTLLSGTNASGKSSVLQALALLHQTMREHEWSTKLMLNGKSIRLGSVTDVVDEINGLKSFNIGIVDDEHSYSWEFTGERNELSMLVERTFIDNKHYQQQPLQRLLPAQITTVVTNSNVGNSLSGIYISGESPIITASRVVDLQNRLTDLTYITAERIGPREVYALEDSQTAPVVGPMGEHAMSLFYLKRDEPILDDLTTETESRNTLFHQVTARMRQFFPECGLAIEQVPNVNAVTLRLRTSDSGEFHRPMNVGFGLTQVLPIVIAALSTAKRDIILIENPEVHLHPAGQALMGELLAQVANAGVQVILETHSDHILNGIRRYVKAGGISPEQVALHFFKARSANAAQVVSPQINSNGDLDNWPDGFFDQFDKDMNHFAGWD